MSFEMKKRNSLRKEKYRLVAELQNFAQRISVAQTWLLHKIALNLINLCTIICTTVTTCDAATDPRLMPNLIPQNKISLLTEIFTFF